MKLASGLHRIGGSDIVNCYLVADSDGVTIIDSGLPGHWDLLVAELSAMGKTLDDVRALILTHGDTDHIGFAARLHRERGIAAHLHEADVERARLQVKKPNSGWGPVKIGPLASFLWYSVRHGGLRIPPATELTPVGDGEVLDVPGSPRIIHTPGHTPGSLSVHVPGVDALFLGDTMTTRNVLTGASGPKPAPFTLDPLRPSHRWTRSRRSTPPGYCPDTARPGTAVLPRRCSSSAPRQPRRSDAQRVDPACCAWPGARPIRC